MRALSFLPLAFVAGCSDNAGPSVESPPRACAAIETACAPSTTTNARARDCYGSATDPTATAASCTMELHDCLASCSSIDAGGDAAETGP